MHEPPAFDGQAASFDERAGLPAASGAIARTVVDLGRVRDGDRVVEVGAGTGEIGCELSRQAPRYLGFDLSFPMLEQFRRRLQAEGGNASVDLAQADGSRAWPIASGTARVIFGSRVLHLLDADVVRSESRRVGSDDGACLLIGRRERDEEGVKARMRRRMRQLMRDRGLKPRQGERSRQSLLDGLIVDGATPIEPITAARWTVRNAPRESIESWKKTGGLGGIVPTAHDKDAILRDLEAFGAEEFGSLDVLVESVESYVVEGVWLAPATHEENR